MKSFLVLRVEPGKDPVSGRASSPEKAFQFAKLLRYYPAAIGTTVTVEGWAPWVYHGVSDHHFFRGWKREPLRKPHDSPDGYVL